MDDFIGSRFWPWLLKSSWQAAVLIVLVLLLNWALERRISPRWRHGLWLIVALRLALPWTIPSPVSLFNVVKFSKAPTTGGDSIGPANIAEPTATQPPITLPRAGEGYSWLPLVWGAGVFGLGIWLVFTHWRLVRRVSARRPLIDGAVMNLLEDCKETMGVRVPVTLVETEAVDGPCLFGFLRPRLLLPLGFTRHFTLDELRHVFLHELGHVKRHDIPIGWLTAVLQILHWFNPLVWLAFSRMRADRELACDALALSYAKEPDGKPYGQTIVKLLTSFGDSLRGPSLAGIVEDKNQMKERITMIAKFQKTRGVPVLAAVVASVLGVLTLTDCQSATTETNALATGTPGTAPVVIAFSPWNAAKNVDPDLKEISVTFNQDMGQGMSWTGGGPEYPTIPEGAHARWRDRRTCVLPVKLERGHLYRVGINSTSYQNFRSASGVPAQPSVFYFSTRGSNQYIYQMLPPRLVAYDPPNGAKDVSTATSELRVTFNVTMGRGMSWCMTGDTDHDFPKTPEGAKSYWTADRQTCVLPVELKPGTTYRISLNAADYINFQSVTGVPLKPVIYTFRTSDN
ncbi:MAG TPA: M56 family metallopeptidase [Verrucomicrobiae bacterium]|nr:M56 family metallopeptidase [Verrucomicrobiae bacterium]